MSALKPLAFALLACTVACDGPTLIVGEFMEPPEVDASMPEDAGEPEPDAAPERDTSVRDARPEEEDGGLGVQFCDLAKPCKDLRFSRCLPVNWSGFGVCGQCLIDVDCEPGEYCDQAALFRCKRDVDRHDPKPNLP